MTEIEGIARRIVAVLAISAVAFAIPALAQQDEPMMVGVDPVRSEPLQQTTDVLGRLVARESGVVAARTPGPVAEMRVHVGDRVDEGDVLVVLVKDTLEAQVALRQAQVETARQELARIERLRQSGSAAFQRSRFEDTLQTLAQAEANLRIAEIALANAEVRAPYPGVVTERHTAAGAYLSAGAPVVSLVNIANVEIEADVPAMRIDALQPGREVLFRLQGRDGTFTSRVRAIVPQENPATRTVPVRFTPGFPNASLTPRVGQTVNLDIPIGESREVVTVHKDAVLARGGGYTVLVVEDGVAQPRPVELGEAVGNRFIVNSGLAPGDLVIVRGNERVRPGQPVRTTRDS